MASSQDLGWVRETYVRVSLYVDFLVCNSSVRDVKVSTSQFVDNDKTRRVWVNVVNE